MSHKKAHKAQKLIIRLSVFFVLFCGTTGQGQRVPQVYLTFNTPDFKLWVVKHSPTVAKLERHGGFSFVSFVPFCG